MISPLQLAKLVQAYQAREAARTEQVASVSALDTRHATDSDVTRAA
jgi:hypothetical protein